jgi:hypothetical protein
MLRIIAELKYNLNTATDALGAGGNNYTSTDNMLGAGGHFGPRQLGVATYSII